MKNRNPITLYYQFPPFTKPIHVEMTTINPKKYIFLNLKSDLFGHRRFPNLFSLLYINLCIKSRWLKESNLKSSSGKLINTKICFPSFASLLSPRSTLTCNLLISIWSMHSYVIILIITLKIGDTCTPCSPTCCSFAHALLQIFLLAHFSWKFFPWHTFTQPFDSFDCFHLFIMKFQIPFKVFPKLISLFT